MTRVSYSDVSATSPDGRFTLEARSADNGTIPLPNGQPAPVRQGERFHQRNFRYQLLETATRRVLWERWQGEREASAGSLLVSNDGWSVLQTSGFYPEFVSISPSGKETARVRIYPIYDNHGPIDPPEPVVNPTTPTFDWPALGARGSTAGIFWSRHSEWYFINHAGQPFFVCRTAWDERLVLRMEPAALIPESEQAGSPLAAAMDEVEKRWVREQLQSFVPMRDSPRFPDRDYTLDRIRLPLHLAGFHGMTDCIALIQPWDRFDLPRNVGGSFAFEDSGCSFSIQALRPILNHSLQYLGQRPSPLPAYSFELRNAGPLALPACSVDDRATRIPAFDSSLPARQILELLGTPDHIAQRKSRASTSPYERFEFWEFDYLLTTGWHTLTVLWDWNNGKPRIHQVEKGPSPWLNSLYRAHWLLKPMW
jgi:hypothetical protein